MFFSMNTQGQMADELIAPAASCVVVQNLVGGSYIVPTGKILLLFSYDYLSNATSQATTIAVDGVNIFVGTSYSAGNIRLTVVNRSGNYYLSGGSSGVVNQLNVLNTNSGASTSNSVANFASGLSTPVYQDVPYLLWPLRAGAAITISGSFQYLCIFGILFDA